MLGEHLENLGLVHLRPAAGPQVNGGGAVLVAPVVTEDKKKTLTFDAKMTSKIGV